MLRISAGREKKGKGLRELEGEAIAREDRVLRGASSSTRGLRTRPLRLLNAGAYYGQLLAVSGMNTAHLTSSLESKFKSGVTSRRPRERCCSP